MIETIPHFSSNIFKPIDYHTNVNAQNESVLIASHLTIPQKGYQNCFAELTSRHLSLTFDFEEKFSVEITYDLKFEVILLNEKDIKSKKIGFQISKKNVEESQPFFCNDLNQLEKWISNLSRMLNQLSFHRQFKAIRKLGKGQFATVFEVENLENGEKLAVKAFSKGLLSKTEKGMDSLLNEIKILRSFEHENLQKILGIFESDNSVYIVTELLRGGSLFDRLQKLHKLNKVMGDEEIREFLNGIISGLNTLSEKRIAHRDLKPDNIMLRNTHNFEPVIIDFGLATFVDEDEYLYYRCGTPGYVSPEVMNSTKFNKIEPICDIFSIGSVFHHLLTLRPLFDGKTAEEIFQKNKAFLFDFKSPFYENIDVEAMELLKAMLEIDENLRICPHEALMSDYINFSAKHGSPVPTVAEETGEEIREYLNF